MPTLRDSIAQYIGGPPEWTLGEVVSQLRHDKQLPQLPKPEYNPSNDRSQKKIMLAVESMKRHMTDEGWQISDGLQHAGYILCGKNLAIPSGHVPDLLRATNPDTVVVQDKREWDVVHKVKSFRDPGARFTGIRSLLDSRAFKLTILKDSHQQPDYHRESAEEMGVHAWIIYYHPKVVKHLATYVRPEHLIRTYHSVDADAVPLYSAERPKGALLSGAVSGAYPFRATLFRKIHCLPATDVLKHPGYHMNGCSTPSYLKLLSQYKVVIATASVYGYSLRRIFEATACGCIVLTTLPIEDELPEIDGNLVRIHPGIHSKIVGQILKALYAKYDPERQEHFAKKALAYYDYRASGQRLAADIEALKRTYQ